MGVHRSGLIALSDGVRAYFAQNEVPAEVTKVGLKYRTFRVNQGPGGGSRVCIIPGEFDGDLAPKPARFGKLKKPRHNATEDGNPRALAWWEKPFTVSIWGVDLTDLGDEEKQLQATEDLFELTVRALRAAFDPVTQQPVGLADIVEGPVVLNRKEVERNFGFELLAQFTHNGPLFDSEVEIGFPDGAIARDPAS